MRDGLTAFSICDSDEYSSLASRETSQPCIYKKHLERSEKVNFGDGKTTSPASDISPFYGMFDDDQSVTAFYEIDRRRADSTDVEEHINNLRAFAHIRNADRIADRTADLLELYKEDYDGKSLLSSSLATFVEFLNLNSNSRFPTITATPTGELYVQWKYDDCQRLSIQFLGGSEIKWVVFKRNSMHEQRVDSLSGQTMVDSFFEIANTLGIQGWISE
ncbi:hypothetical protein PMI21_03527 [Pseudomonas sp. GM18]|uniref:hypothetical protein n=1 Tax=Pseudomonas sp. GM18 TaxID=1144324 RepID=UPI0002727C09|nr:hypothetical protein [Pseudomonas sp. GM18]EJM14805.1 hypothetical protein PMI21_03527 [Pseudomonas sp. GM18]